MREFDIDGLLMCKIQGKIFERSITEVNLSSPIFVKNYMNSLDAESMDRLIFLNTCRYDTQILENFNKEKPYGRIKYDNEEMFWMGYLYRYFSYTYELSSKQIYKIIPANALRKLYFTYHTLDVSKAIERILEARELTLNIKENYDTLLKTSIEKEIKEKGNYILPLNK